MTERLHLDAGGRREEFAFKQTADKMLLREGNHLNIMKSYILKTLREHHIQ